MTPWCCSMCIDDRYVFIYILLFFIACLCAMWYARVYHFSHGFTHWSLKKIINILPTFQMHFLHRKFCYISLEFNLCVFLRVQLIVIHYQSNNGLIRCWTVMPYDITGQQWTTVKPLIYVTLNHKKMFLVSSCSCPCPIHWSQVQSREWRCSWSSADRRCSNCIWVINKVIAYWGATYIRSLMVTRYVSS